MTDLREMYDTVIAAIEKIDNTLDSASDAKGAGQRAHVNSLVKEQEGEVNNILTQLSGFLDGLTVEGRIGFVTGLRRELDSKVKTEQNEYLENWAKENVSDGPKVTLSEEEISKLETDRKDFYGRAKQILALAEGFGTLTDDMVMPKKRTGSRGARGPQKWSQYTYFLNDEQVEDDDNNITVLAKNLGFEKATPLKDLIKSQMGDEWEPGKDFEVNVTVNGATVVFSGVFPETEVEVEVETETEVDSAAE